jgi:hypothetical protein
VRTAAIEEREERTATGRVFILFHCSRLRVWQYEHVKIYWPTCSKDAAEIWAFSWVRGFAFM